jgi:hypothetical protein
VLTTPSFLSIAIQGREGRFFETAPFELSFLTLSRNAVVRSDGGPCFFNKSLKASSASSWKSIILSRASRSSSCHVQSSNRIRLPGTGGAFSLDCSLCELSSSTIGGKTPEYDVFKKIDKRRLLLTAAG